MDKTYKSEDYLLFVGQAKGLLPNNIKFTEDDMQNAQGFSSPSLLNAVSKEDNAYSALIAAVCAANGSGKNIAVRRSVDDGKSFSPLETVLIGQINSKTAFGAKKAFCFTNPSLAAAYDGRVLMLVNMFPEGGGTDKNSITEERSAYIDVGAKSYPALYEDAPPSGRLFAGIKLPDFKKDKNDAALPYTVREDGWIFAPDGERTDYYIPQSASAEYGYRTLGDMYYAVGEPDYIDAPPPLMPPKPESGKDIDIYAGNIYLNRGKPAFSASAPVPALKNKVAPWLDKPDYFVCEGVEAPPAPLRAAVRPYLWLLESRDGGAAFGQPADITFMTGDENDKGYLAVSPGTGICLKNQSYFNKMNRIIYPCVSGRGKAAVIFSDDNGKTWDRPPGGYIQNTGDTQIIELSDGTLYSFGQQKRLGRTPFSRSIDGGNSWRSDTSQNLISVGCAKSAALLPSSEDKSRNVSIRYPDSLDKTKQYVLSSHPTGNLGKDSTKSTGVVTLGEVQDNGQIKWMFEKELKTDDIYASSSLKGNEKYFAGSSITLLGSGNIGVVYEAYPGGYIAFSQFNLEWAASGNPPLSDIYGGDAAKIIAGLIALFAAGIILLDRLRQRRRAMVFAEGDAEYDILELAGDYFPGAGLQSENYDIAAVNDDDIKIYTPSFAEADIKL
ncbi:MAG: glycoside hydrolase [Oscillospiraceae bacterium]|nr:glycoside hydrolase [Oscillospiraceae bacterium]